MIHGTGCSLVLILLIEIIGFVIDSGNALTINISALKLIQSPYDVIGMFTKAIDVFSNENIYKLSRMLAVEEIDLNGYYEFVKDSPFRLDKLLKHCVRDPSLTDLIMPIERIQYNLPIHRTFIRDHLLSYKGTILKRSFRPSLFGDYMVKVLEHAAVSLLSKVNSYQWCANIDDDGQLISILKSSYSWILLHSDCLSNLMDLVPLNWSLVFSHENLFYHNSGRELLLRMLRWTLCWGLVSVNFPKESIYLRQSLQVAFASYPKKWSKLPHVMRFIENGMNWVDFNDPEPLLDIMIDLLDSLFPGKMTSRGAHFYTELFYCAILRGIHASDVGSKALAFLDKTPPSMLSTANMVLLRDTIYNRRGLSNVFFWSNSWQDLISFNPEINLIAELPFEKRLVKWRREHSLLSVPIDRLTALGEELREITHVHCSEFSLASKLLKFVNSVTSNNMFINRSGYLVPFAEDFVPRMQALANSILLSFSSGTELHLKNSINELLIFDAFHSLISHPETIDEEEVFIPVYLEGRVEIDKWRDGFISLRETFRYFEISPYFNWEEMKFMIFD